MIQYFVSKYKRNTNLSEVGMDIQPQSTQPISDDQELAKVLAGVNATADEAENASSTPAMSDITAPIAPSTPPPVEPAVNDSVTTPAPFEPEVATPALSPLPTPSVSSPAPARDLDAVKQDAITELRPLVDKLTLAPEEKFDTYLLLIRSTDDKSLIAPAHEAAKAITDETRRAQALLDIIKEIDFLSGQQ
jgi:hypothetical protein